MMIGAVREIFKYTTKTANYDKLDKSSTHLLAAWIQESKGKNFLNACGIFRGLQLTGLKSKYDEEYTPTAINPSSSYYLDKTSAIIYSHPTYRNYSTADRRQLLSVVYLLALSESAYHVTDLIDDVMGQLTLGRSDSEIDMSMQQVIDWAQERADDFRSAVNDIWEYSDQSAANEKRMVKQLSFIDQLFTH